MRLIEQYNGDTKSITARMIAEQAGIGLGLINYHFGSKDKLITECVQRIIGEVVVGVQMNLGDCRKESDRSEVHSVAFFYQKIGDKN